MKALNMISMICLAFLEILTMALLEAIQPQYTILDTILISILGVPLAILISKNERI